MKYEAVIFDMDGVIFDTEVVSRRGWCKVAQKYGLEDMENEFLNIIGTNSRYSKQYLLKRYGQFDVDTFMADCRVEFKRDLKENGIPVKPGVRQLLAYLKENGYKVALASSTESEIVIGELKASEIYQYFDFVIGGDMVSHSKPDPEIFLKACARLGATPDRALVIEDSYNGIRAASSGGFYAVMVPDVLPPTEEMRQKADIILSSLSQVQQWLNSCK